jgi:hypothetical protein
MPPSSSPVARFVPAVLALATAGCLFAGPSDTGGLVFNSSPSVSVEPSASAPTVSASATEFPIVTRTRLPDLGMAPIRNFRIETTEAGQTRLRFTTIIINIGDGPMLLWGHTPQSDGELLVDQRIATEGGALRDKLSDFRMYFAGDGHRHWHLRDLETYVLQNTDATLQRTSEKHGFCFFDSDPYDLALPRAPRSPLHPRSDCAKATDMSVTMGLSVGWADTYQAGLPDQYVDISGLPSGEYILTATVDAQDFLVERCETNNSTIAVLGITATTVKVIDRGAASAACL